MKTWNKLILLLMAVPTMCAEAQSPSTSNPAFDAELSKLLTFSVPAISAEDVKRRQSEVLIFDAREKAEFDVSHLPGARYLGYEAFNPELLRKIPKDAAIVLYCSVGYRSEKIGEKLKGMGYTKVYNLYGSIFEWANHGFPLEKSPGKPATELHTYNEEWSKWVTNPKVKKVW